MREVLTMLLPGFLPGYRPMRHRQMWITLLVVLLCLTGVGLLFIIWIDRRIARSGRHLLGRADPNAAPQPCDCIMVLGAPVNPDGSPGLQLTDRLDSALSIYRSGLADRILVSGDHGQDDYDEVTVMRQYLLDRGVVPEHIFVDPAGFDTYESLVRAQRIFAVRKAVVTTQTDHLLRALYMGSQLGLDLQGITSDSRFYPHRIRHRLRETIARFKAFWDCEIFHTKPMVLGAITPISGNGPVSAQQQGSRPGQQS
jgi:SanA protein